MKSLWISMDVDGVLRDSPQAICDAYRTHYDPDSTIGPEDMHSYDLKEVFPKLTSISDFFKDHAEELFLHAAPYPDAAAVMQRIYQQHFLNITTGQARGYEHLTDTWLRTHGMVFYDLHATFDKHLIPAEVIVDDNPVLLQGFKKSHPSAVTVLVEHPYNEGFEADRAISGIGALPSLLEKLL